MADTIKACSFTGYRPDKFSFPFCDSSPEYRDFENKLIEAVFEMSDEGCTDFYCGMAHGFDIVAGETVNLLKNSILQAIYALPSSEYGKSATADLFLRDI